MRREFVVILSCALCLFLIAYFDMQPLRAMMDWRASQNAKSERSISISDYHLYNYADNEELWLTVDFVKGKHFWNPQIVIWLEDSTGRYLETLFITTSTAKGLFYSGRTQFNFKRSDESKGTEATPVRRVDALPYWSHKRGQQYDDGFYSPPPTQPLPDGITGATPTGNFYFKGKNEHGKLGTLRVMVEVNVAFDDNEYYSEYDFLDDSLYHGGAGLLGQPSIIYGCTVTKTDHDNYYLLEVKGHGHHSGMTGELFSDMTTMTTAKEVAERIVVGVNRDWYMR